MIPKPVHLGPEYGGQFRDQSIVDSYATRPPYPAKVFSILEELIIDEPRIVLDLGCGTGDIARNFASSTERIDAVDPSVAMLAHARTLPGGNDLRINWINATAEEFDYPATYALAVTAESLHWMEWYFVLPKIGRTLSEHGRLAVVGGRSFTTMPWRDGLEELIARYSTNREYQPYNVIEELEHRKLFNIERKIRTEPVPFTQSVQDYIESFHSRNGLSRQRLSDGGRGFDEELRELIGRFTDSDKLTFDLSVNVTIGCPVTEV
jgi:ubiquinone/menaquinone biosynthesis C-methylase UbiE